MRIRTCWILGLAFVALAALALGCRGAATTPGFQAQRALEHVQALAADELEGRRTGSAGGERGADLVAAAFRRAGLQPAGDDGTYLDHFTFPHYTIVAPTRLVVADAAGARELRFRDDYFFLTGSGDSEGTAGLVYVGYGISAPELDELAGVDVRGKVLLAMQGKPSGVVVDRSLISNIGKARKAREAGAAGMLLFAAGDGDEPLDESRIWSFRPANYLEGFLLGRVHARVAEQLLGSSVADLEKEIDATGAAASRPTAAQITWDVNVVYEPEGIGANVLGLLPGRDPQLADELIVVNAHYDGGGVDPDGVVYNGAEDDASGTAAVMELARAFGAVGEHPARSVLFAGWGAEEQGRWGSERWAERGKWPIDAIVLNLTFDNVGVGEGRFRLWASNNFPDELAWIAAHVDPDLWQRFTPRGYGGSDGYTFQMRGVPTFFAHADAPQPYVHTPEDDADTVSLEMLDTVGRFGMQVLRAAADAPDGTFDRDGRLARYVSRYAFVIGHLSADAALAADWEGLRRQGLDAVIVDAATAADAAAVVAALPEGVVLVRGSSDLSDTEEGAPLRVLIAPKLLRATAGGYSLGDLAVVRVAGADAAVAALGAATGGSDGGALLIDASSSSPPAAIVGSLLEAGVDADTVQAWLGGNLRAALALAFERLEVEGR